MIAEALGPTSFTSTRNESIFKPRIPYKTWSYQGKYTLSHWFFNLQLKNNDHWNRPVLWFLLSLPKQNRIDFSDSAHTLIMVGFYHPFSPACMDMIQVGSSSMDNRKEESFMYGYWEQEILFLLGFLTRNNVCSSYEWLENNQHFATTRDKGSTTPRIPSHRNQ